MDEMKAREAAPERGETPPEKGMSREKNFPALPLLPAVIVSSLMENWGFFESCSLLHDEY